MLRVNLDLLRLLQNLMTALHDDKNSVRNQPMCHHLQYLHEELAKTFAAYIRFQLNFITTKKNRTLMTLESPAVLHKFKSLTTHLQFHNYMKKAHKRALIFQY